MKLPTLRQISGFVMIVNTFLPALAVVILAWMILSTTAAIERNACTTIGQLTVAFKDIDARIERAKTAHDPRLDVQLADLVAALPATRRTTADGCEVLDDVGRILADRLYRDTVEGIVQPVRDMGEKLDTLKQQVEKVIPPIKLPAIPPIGVPNVVLLREAVMELNKAIGDVNGAFRAVGREIDKGMRGVRNAVTGVFVALVNPEKDHLVLELKRAGYKRQAAWELTKTFVGEAIELLKRFYWFFVVLAVWLVLSYALWVHRRLAVGWALLRNREAI